MSANIRRRLLLVDHLSFPGYNRRATNSRRPALPSQEGMDALLEPANEFCVDVGTADPPEAPLHASTQPRWSCSTSVSLWLMWILMHVRANLRVSVFA